MEITWNWYGWWSWLSKFKEKKRKKKKILVPFFPIQTQGGACTWYYLRNRWGPCYRERCCILLPYFSSRKQHCQVIRLSCLDTAFSVFVLVGHSVGAPHILRHLSMCSWWAMGTFASLEKWIFQVFCLVIVISSNWEYGMGNKMN